MSKKDKENWDINMEYENKFLIRSLYINMPTFWFI